ncbi:MAG TPA: hypothetical protein VII23_17425 [Terriglobales bacterium]
MDSVLSWKFMLLAALLLTDSRAPSAQQAASPIEPGSSQTAVDVCLHRSIALTVLRNQEQPATVLEKVQVLVNGNLANLVSFSTDSGPTRVLLLIDSSASMGPSNGGEGWGVTLPLAAFAMDAVPLNAAVAVGRFAERLQLSQWQDRNSAREQVSSLKYQSPKGSTALYSSVSEAVSVFREVQFGDTVYLVTDGGDNHSAMDSHRFVQSLVARNTRVFVFLVVPKEPYKTSEERDGAQAMEDLANLTGGFLFRLPQSSGWLNTGEAAIVAKQIRETVSSPYQVVFQLAAPLTKPSKLKLETPLDPKHFTLAYPRRLEPCTTAPPH